MDPRKSYWFASKDIYEAFRLLNKEALTPTVFNIKDFRTECETLDSVIQACYEGKCILSAVDKEASQDWSEEEVTDWHDRTQRPMKGTYQQWLDQAVTMALVLQMLANISKDLPERHG
ncbi:hypothetical protein ACHAPM_010241 [Fusarium culmorum]